MNKRRLIAVIITLVMACCAMALIGCSESKSDRYVVTYDANGGYFQDSGTKTYYEKVKKGGHAVGKKTPVIDDDELVFVGWNTDKNAVVAINLDEYSVTRDVTLYAVWGDDQPAPPTQHTVTFYNNYVGASSEIFLRKSVDDGETVAEPSTDPKRTGYTFDGWFTESVGGSKYDFSDPVTDGFSLYAHWTEVSVAPAVIAIDILYEPTKTEYVVGQEFEVAGLVVQAVYNIPEGKRETLSSGDYTVSEPVMTQVGEQTVTVTYTPQNGTPLKDEFKINIVPRAISKVELGGDLANKTQEKDLLFDPSGLTFTAVWNDGVRENIRIENITFTSDYLTDGKFNAATDSAEIKAVYGEGANAVEADHSIYVKVVEPAVKKYNVTFDKNSKHYAAKVTGMPTKPQIVEENTKAQKPTNDPALKGFIFGGWYKEAECTTAWDFNTETVKEHTTIYAKWTAIEYTITYVMANGTNNPQNIASYTVNADDEFTVFELKTPEKGHNTFGGWFSDSAFVERVTDGITYDFVTAQAEDDNNVTLYAKWTPNTYTISFKWGETGYQSEYTAEFASGYTAPSSYTYGTETPLPAETDIVITKVNTEVLQFTFIGWYEEGDTNKTHKTKIAADAHENITFVADIVAAATYTVTFDYNYDGKSEEKKVIRDTATTALSPASRVGYTFDKWYTAADLKTPFDFEKTPIKSDTTVYAGWTPVEYEVEYEKLPTGAVNGNPVKYTVVDGTNKDGIVALTAITSAGLPEGYRFFGWYTDSNCTQAITELTPELIAADTEVITVYAKCNNEYTVVYRENVTEGEVIGMPEERVVKYGATIDEPTAPTRVNYTFGGWYTTAACDTAFVFNGESEAATQIKPAADVDAVYEIFAKWIANPESGVYVFGSVNDSDMHAANIADYKVTVTGDADKTYEIHGLTLNAEDSFKLIEYAQADGKITWVAPAAEIAVHPQAGMSITTRGGDYVVGDKVLDGAVWTLTVKGGKADFVLERTGSQYISLRAVDGTAASYTESAKPQADAVYVAGNFTNDFKLYDEWSTADGGVESAVSANGTVILKNIHLEKNDEFRLVKNGVSVGGEFAVLGAPITLAEANANILFGGESGNYNFVYDTAAGTLKVVAATEITAALKADTKVYVGKTPVIGMFDITADSADISADCELIAGVAASGENTVTVIYINGGTFATVTYTATEDTVTAVAIVMQPKKTEYYVGEKLDFGDVELSVTYESGDVVEVSGDKAELFGKVTFDIADGFYAEDKFTKDGTATVVIGYDGFKDAANCTVSVNIHNELTSLALTGPSNVQYIVGTSEDVGVGGLDLTGLVVTAYYNGTDSDSAMPCTGTVNAKTDTDNGYVVTAENLNLNVKGEYVITVTYTETFGEGESAITRTVSKTFTVNVLDAWITEVTATGTPDKAVQLVGSAFDGTGIKFIGTKNDGKPGAPMLASEMTYELTVDGAPATNEAGLLVKSGTATVKASYGEGDKKVEVVFASEVTIEIADKLSSIEVTSTTVKSYPQQTDAEKAKQLFMADNAGIAVAASYNIGIAGASEVTGKTIALEDCEIEVDLSTVGDGKGVITVGYTENGITVEKTINVNVTEPVIVSVAVVDATQLVKKQYFVGDNFDPTGLKFTAKKDNGDIVENIEHTDANLTYNGGAAFTVASDASAVVIKYNDITVTGDVSVKVVNKLTSIAVTVLPQAPHPSGETKIWVAGDTLQFNGMEVTAYYNNTTAESATPVKDVVTAYTTDAENIDMSSDGTKTITVTYIENEIERTTTFTINVEPKTPTKISVKEGSTIPTQSMGATLKTAGIEFIVEYNNEKSDPIAASELVFTCTDFDNSGVFGMGEMEGTTIKAYESTVNVALKSDATKILGSFKVNVQFTGEYTISFVCLNGDYEVKNAPAEAGVKRNQLIPKPEDPTCKGFTFDGWYTEPAHTTAWTFESDTVNGNMSLYGKWTAVNYTVNFNEENDGFISATAFNATDGVFGTLDLMTVSAAEKTNYEHVGWYIDGVASVTLKVLDYAALPETGKVITLKPVYELVKHTVTFDLNGAEGEAPEVQKVEHGKFATVPTEPTREHYTFGGWYLTATPSESDTAYVFDTAAVNGDIILYAKWIADTYTVTFDLNGAEGTAPAQQTVAYNQNATVPTEPTRAHYAFGGWFTTATPSESDTAYVFETTAVTGNITLYAKWTEITHTVNFVVDGETVSTVTVKDGETVTAPTESPVKRHYTFAKWVKTGETEAFDFAQQISADVTLNADWNVYEYTVVYSGCDGETRTDGGNPTKYKVTDGTVALNPATTTSAAEVFVKWTNDLAETVSALTESMFDNTKGVISVTIHANYDAKSMVKVTFDSVGGTSVEPMEVEAGSKITAPTAPTKAHHSFIAWYKDAGYTTAWNFDDAVTAAMTLYAKWEIDKVNVTFDPNGIPGAAEKVVKVDYGAKASAEALTMPEGHVFDYWYSTDDKVAYNFETAVEADITLHAKWHLQTYAVTFESNGGSAVTVDPVEYGGKIVKPRDPTRAGYSFVGWYKDDKFATAWNFDTDTVKGEVTLYANWSETLYTVTFVMNGGTPAIEAQNVGENGKVTEPDAPTKAGNRFDGWYSDDKFTKAYVFDTPVTADLTLYAKWVVQVTVTYNLNLPDGKTASDVTNAPKNETLDVKTAAKEPTKPELEGYAFNGWFTDKAGTSQWLFDTVVAKSMTLYAKWTKVADAQMTVTSGGKDTVLDMLDNTDKMTADEKTKYIKNYAFFGEHKVTLKANDLLTFKVNKTAVSFALDTYSKNVELVTGSTKQLKVKADGEYEFYLKQKKDGTWEIYGSGGPIPVIPEGAVAVGTDTVYLVGKFGESNVTYEYGYAMKEDSSTQHSITKVLAVGDMFAGWHKGWNMWVAEIENDMTGKLSTTTVDGKTYIKVDTAGTYTLYCKHVSGGKNQFYVGYSSGGDTGDKEPVLTGKSAVFKFSDATIVICLTNVPSWATAGSEFVHIWTNDTDAKDCSLDGKSTYTFAGKLTSYNILVAFKEGTAWKKTADLTKMACKVGEVTKTMSDGHVYTFNTGANASGAMTWVDDGVFEYTCKETAITYKE